MEESRVEMEERYMMCLKKQKQNLCWPIIMQSYSCISKLISSTCHCPRDLFQAINMMASPQPAKGSIHRGTNSMNSFLTMLKIKIHG